MATTVIIIEPWCLGLDVRKSKIPANWLNFLHDPNNKTELFAFLTRVASEKMSLEGKETYITSDESVVSLCPSISMPDCTHEEIDTRIMVRYRCYS